MVILLTFVIAFFFGYLYGYKIKPNKRLRAAIAEVKEQCRAALEEGNRGVYKTMVTDEDKVSELVVEIKELAVTDSGQVKVEYLNAQYQNPAFRTKKGEALLNEVKGLLGEYLPLHEIEWYNARDRHETIKNHVVSLDSKFKRHYRA